MGFKKGLFIVFLLILFSFSFFGSVQSSGNEFPSESEPEPEPPGDDPPPEEPPEPIGSLSDAKDQQKEPLIGEKKAEVKIVAYMDFAGPFSKRFMDNSFDILMSDYEGQISFEFRNFPLSFLKNDEFLALAGECAHAQKKFYSFARIIYNNFGEANPDNINEFAEEAGLKVKQFQKCVESEKYLPEVYDDIASGQELGVTGTPTFFFEGSNRTIKFVGATIHIEIYKSIIDALLLESQ